MTRNSVVVSISLNPSEQKIITQLSKQEQKTKSQIVREALRQYRFEKNLSKIQKTGIKIASKFDIDSYEDIEKFAQ